MSEAELDSGEVPVVPEPTAAPTSELVSDAAVGPHDEVTVAAGTDDDEPAGSATPAEPAPPAPTATLDERLDYLDEALDELEELTEPHIIEPIRSGIAAVRHRVSLGLETTVAALVGGTGSGKSALFNAISGLRFADVGVQRPTTTEVTACIWGESADGLLDRLGVSPERRLLRDDTLDDGLDDALGGLVLLDVPDHDSIELSHQAIVDRVVAAADMLIWVVDPQKYADHMLHDEYLRTLVGHDDTLRVVLNQADRITESDVEILVGDIKKLLIRDGLVDVPVVVTSAETGRGVDELRSMLAVALRQGLAEVRAAAHVRDLAEDVADFAVAGGRAGLTTPVPLTVPSDEVVAGLENAAGIPAVVAGVANSVRSLAHGPGQNVAGRTVLHANAIQTQGVAVARSSWLDDVTKPLPLIWKDAVALKIASTGSLRTRLDEDLESLAVRPRPVEAAKWLHWGGTAFGVLAAALGAVTVIAMLGWRAPVFSSWQAAAASAGVALVLCVLGVGISALLRTRAARSQSDYAAHTARATVTKAVNDDLVRPAQSVIDHHDEVRATLVAAHTGVHRPV